LTINLTSGTRISKRRKPVAQIKTRLLLIWLHRVPVLIWVRTAVLIRSAT